MKGLLIKDLLFYKKHLINTLLTMGLIIFFVFVLFLSSKVGNLKGMGFENISTLLFPFALFFVAEGGLVVMPKILTKEQNYKSNQYMLSCPITRQQYLLEKISIIYILQFSSVILSLIFLSIPIILGIFTITWNNIAILLITSSLITVIASAIATISIATNNADKANKYSLAVPLILLILLAIFWQSKNLQIKLIEFFTNYTALISILSVVLCIASSVATYYFAIKRFKKVNL